MRVAPILLLVSVSIGSAFEIVATDSLPSNDIDYGYWKGMAAFQGKLLLWKEAFQPPPEKTTFALFDPAKPASDLGGLPSRTWNMRISAMFAGGSSFYILINNVAPSNSGFLADSGLFLAKVEGYDSIQVVKRLDFDFRSYFRVYPLGESFLLVNNPDTTQVSLREYDLSGNLRWNGTAGSRALISGDPKQKAYLSVNAALKSSAGEFFVAGSYELGERSMVATLLKLDSRGRPAFERKFDLIADTGYYQYLDDSYYGLRETAAGDVIAIGMGMKAGSSHYIYLNKYTENGDSLGSISYPFSNPWLENCVPYGNKFIVAVSNDFASYRYIYFDETPSRLAVDSLKVPTVNWRDQFHAEAILGDTLYSLIELAPGTGGKSAYTLWKGKLRSDFPTSLSRVGTLRKSPWYERNFDILGRRETARRRIAIIPRKGR